MNKNKQLKEILKDYYNQERADDCVDNYHIDKAIKKINDLFVCHVELKK